MDAPPFLEAAHQVVGWVMRAGLVASPLAEMPPNLRDDAKGFGEGHGLDELDGDPLEDVHVSFPRLVHRGVGRRRCVQ